MMLFFGSTIFERALACILLCTLVAFLFPPATFAATTDINILLRGQSNANMLYYYKGIWNIETKLEARVTGVDIHIIADPYTDSDGATIHNGTAFLDWSVDGEQQSLITNLETLPDDIKDNPTITLWLHNEYDQSNPDLTATRWMAAVKDDARKVRQVLNNQDVRTTPYHFVWVPYAFNNISGEEIQRGMRRLASEPDFRATVSHATDGDLKMDAGPVDGAHFGEADVALVSDRLVDELVPVVEEQMQLVAPDTETGEEENETDTEHPGTPPSSVPPTEEPAPEVPLPEEVTPEVEETDTTVPDPEPVEDEDVPVGEESEDAPNDDATPPLVSPEPTTEVPLPEETPLDSDDEEGSGGDDPAPVPLPESEPPVVVPLPEEEDTADEGVEEVPTADDGSETPAEEEVPAPEEQPTTEDETGGSGEAEQDDVIVPDPVTNTPPVLMPPPEEPILDLPEAGGDDGVEAGDTSTSSDPVTDPDTEDPNIDTGTTTDPVDEDDDEIDTATTTPDVELPDETATSTATSTDDGSGVEDSDIDNEREDRRSSSGSATRVSQRRSAISSRETARLARTIRDIEDEIRTLSAATPVTPITDTVVPVTITDTINDPAAIDTMVTVSGNTITRQGREAVREAVAAWTFNDVALSGRAVRDIAGRNPGELLNGARTEAAALRLSGSLDQGMRIEGMFGKPDSLTLAVWTNLTEVGKTGAEIISLGDNVGLRTDQNGTVLFYWRINDDTWRILTTGVSLKGTGWHHLAGTFDSDSGTVRVYVDGKLVSESVADQSIAYENNGDTYLGRSGMPYDQSLNFTGEMSSVRIYSTVLGEQDIKVLSQSR